MTTRVLLLSYRLDSFTVSCLAVLRVVVRKAFPLASTAISVFRSPLQRGHPATPRGLLSWRARLSNCDTNTSTTAPELDPHPQPQHLRHLSGRTYTCPHFIGLTCPEVERRLVKCYKTDDKKGIDFRWKKTATRNSLSKLTRQTAASLNCNESPLRCTLPT